MHREKVFFLILSFSILSVNSFGQVGFNVAKDSRIEKFQRDIVQYLLDQKQLFGNRNPSKIEDLYPLLLVRKEMELFSEDGSQKILLIRFSTLSDHGDEFWGVLMEKEKNFFYNNKDPGYIKISKEIDKKSFYLIKVYCGFK